jgi:membrane protein YdbS with pleckstrin-like domain
MAVQVEPCDNCGRRIGRLEQAYLWKDHVVCETCYRRLASADAAPGGPDAAPGGADAAGAAVADAMKGAEVVLWSASPSILPYLPRYVLIGLALLGNLIVAALVWWPCLLGAWICLVLAADWELRRRATRYTITRQRVIRRTGYLRRVQQEVETRDVRELGLHQGPIERLVGVGTVEIATAATAKRELLIARVPNAKKVIEILRQART